MSNIILLLGGDSKAKTVTNTFLKESTNIQIFDFPISPNLTRQSIINTTNSIIEKNQISLTIVLDYEKIILSEKERDSNSSVSINDCLKEMNAYLTKQIDSLKECILNVYELLQDDAFSILIVKNGNQNIKVVKDFLPTIHHLNEIYWRYDNKSNTLYLKFLTFLIEKISSCYLLSSALGEKEVSQIAQDLSMKYTLRENIFLKIPQEALDENEQKMIELIQSYDYDSLIELINHLEKQTDRLSLKNLISTLVPLIDINSENFNNLKAIIQQDLQRFQNIGSEKTKGYLKLLEFLSKFNIKGDTYSRAEAIHQIISTIENHINEQQNNLSLQQIEIYNSYSLLDQKFESIMRQIMTIKVGQQKQLFNQFINFLTTLDIQQMLNTLDQMNQQGNTDIFDCSVNKQTMYQIISDHTRVLDNLFIEDSFKNSLTRIMKLDSLKEKCCVITDRLKILTILLENKTIKEVINENYQLSQKITSIYKSWQTKKQELKKIVEGTQIENQTIQMQLKFFENEKQLQQIYQILEFDYTIKPQQKGKLLKDIIQKQKEDIHISIQKQNYLDFIKQYQILEQAEKIIENNEASQQVLQSFTDHKNVLIKRLREHKSIDEKMSINLLIQNILILNNSLDIKIPPPISEIIKEMKKEKDLIK